MDLKFLEEIDCESFFDHVEDLIDFPLEDDCGGFGADECKDFPCIWDDTFPMDDPILCSGNANEPDLSTEIAVPPEDIRQLEWLSTFVEDSFADGGMTITKDDNNINKEPSHNQFRISSPISVLESSNSINSSSCSGGKTLPLSSSHHFAHRARSKRSRPTTFCPRSPIQLISTPSLFGEKPHPCVVPGNSSGSEYFAESPPTGKINNPESLEQKKKKKLKLTFSSGPPEMNQNQPVQAVRKCLHCEITKTPQWRAGPMGPKTLCNACGVRYKSGRLFPEYRPAASPTFVASLHSNSHKRVLEMRNNSIEEGSTALSGISAPTSSQPQLK
ncbi:hypothetical protein Leryth_022564 [Lithospermum erythrorhizon]|nr:hypothetical protein Leryth_022564 [Lithospermum erythrorhizon]